MARNIEIKAKANNFGKQIEFAKRLCDSEPQKLFQEDTFFNVSTGRLKLREFGDGTGELIQYERVDSTGPTESKYVRCVSESPSILKEALTNALGVRAVIKKNRLVCIIGQTRIHLDDVENLGKYVELEYVVGANDTSKDGELVLAELMSKLEVKEEDLVKTAYVDLLDSIQSKN